MGFYYARLVDPEKWTICLANGEPVYAGCADCGAEAPVIHGVIKDDESHHAANFRNDDGVTMRLAVFCEECFEKRLESE